MPVVCLSVVRGGPVGWLVALSGRPVRENKVTGSSLACLLLLACLRSWFVRWPLWHSGLLACWLACLLPDCLLLLLTSHLLTYFLPVLLTSSYFVFMAPYFFHPQWQPRNQATNPPTQHTIRHRQSPSVVSNELSL